MKRCLFLPIFCLCLALAVVAVAQDQAKSTAASSQAQVPRVVKFSGAVKDDAGNPKTGVVGIIFALYKDQEGGAALWLETQNVHLDSKGNYTVLLGSNTAEGLPTEIFSSNDARWLGVQVEGEKERSRTLLVSAPYALKALDAETIGGKPASAFQLATPAAKSGNGPAPALTEQANELTCVSGTACKTNAIPVFASNGGSATLTDSIIAQSGQTLNVAGSVNVLGQGNLFASNGIATGGSINANQTVAGNNITARGNLSANGTVSGAKGVLGNSSSTTNFQAAILGQESATIGETFGVEGFTASAAGAGVYGKNIGASVVGGLIFPLTGVWGDTNKSGNSGVLGTADDGNALAGVNGSALFATLQLNNDEGASASAPVLNTFSPAFNGSCTIDVSGNLKCTGSKSAVVPVDNGTRKVALYAVEAPENWFEDFGSGRLAGGAATVALEPTFAQTVNPAMEYHVFVTPKGDCNGLNVANETPAGFEVHEFGGGHSNVAFDYRIVARRKGYENIRLADNTKQSEYPRSISARKADATKLPHN